MDWIFELKGKVLQFINKLKSESSPGYFKYTLSGDLYDENLNWGLGNTVFAVKIYYTLNLLNELPIKEKEEMARFIKSFQQKDGVFFDPLIKRKAFLRGKLSSFKNWNFDNFVHQQVIRAETRQSVSALNLLGEKPEFTYKRFPKSEEEIEKYLLKLNWRKPWGAGSHFSHLIFFLKSSNLENKENLIDFLIKWVNKLQSSETGSWYEGEPSLQQKINGAMKIITALKAVNRLGFNYPEKLIQLCLSAKNDEHACDNFNISYVLKYANQLTDFTYRYKEIRKFTLDRLNIYKSYYYPEIGGFSFFPGKANSCYYGAVITKGFDEPDIHGTCMFLWGTSIVSQILGIEKQLAFKEQIP
ncbi:MAG: hypothetical protein ISS47_01490 [Candidatus Omnitrophica bacterium]|nr:hypothetical protein [Candidatus Omnitrophota bacterium]